VRVGSVAPMRMVAGPNASRDRPNRTRASRPGLPSSVPNAPRYTSCSSRNVSGVARTMTTRISSSTPYIRSGRRTLSPIRPPIALPIAMPPKKPVRIAEIACVVLPKTRTSWRAQTTSYTRPAAPDRMKMPRIGQRRVTGETPWGSAAAGTAAPAKTVARVAAGAAASAMVSRGRLRRADSRRGRAGTR
jgi:hypothetical protein